MKRKSERDRISWAARGKMISVPLLCSLLLACSASEAVTALPQMSEIRTEETAAPAAAAEPEANTENQTEAAPATEAELFVRQTLEEETEAPHTEPPPKKPGTEVTIHSEAQTEQPQRIDPQTGGIVHIVRPGDTLTSLASRYYVHTEDLLAWNRIPDPDRLAAGLRLVIREPGEPPDTAQPAETEPALTRTDNSPYGWSYPAGDDAESLLNGYNAYSRIPGAEKQLLLTFDALAPKGDNASALLAILDEMEVPALFFVDADFLAGEPETVREMLADGHAVGNHTVEHLNPPEVLASVTPERLTEDVVGLEILFEEITGRKIDPYLRPPAGSWSERSLNLYRDLGYTTLFWDLSYKNRDPEQTPEAAEALELLQNQTRDGAILRLHTTHDTNLLILSEYIDWARAEGYTFARPADVFSAE